MAVKRVLHLQVLYVEQKYNSKTLLEKMLCWRTDVVLRMILKAS